MGSPLAGARVLEISSGVAGAYAGRMLRGYGAHVRHVEAPGVSPLADDERTYLHAGKPHERVPADWDASFAGADIVISDRQPAQLAALGLDWGAVRARHPHLVVVSVTPYGLTGPYADWQSTNAVAFAMGGIMSLTGDLGRTPLVTGGNQAYVLAGLNAFAAALTCWYGRRRNGGRGELVDLSAQECAAGMMELYRASTAVGGPVIPRLGNHTRATWGIYPCLDGWAGAFCLARQIPALFSLLDDPELAEERFTDAIQRGEPLNEEALTAKMYVYFMDKTKAEVLSAGLAAKVPVGVAMTPADLLAMPGLHERDAFDRIGDVLVPGAPFPGFGWRPSDEAPASAPEWAPRPAPAADAARGALPLAGVRVLDLTMMWAGPYATMNLANMGADVIKIESPSAWDNIRTLVPQPGAPDPWNSAYYFQAYNRDKRSLSLDLAQEEGKAVMRTLIATADVLIENYRADVLDKLGFTDDVLQAANPKLVTISMAAFGKAGQDRDYVGFGPVIELMSGLCSLSGYEGDEEPFKTGISYGDPIAGLNACAAIILGLAQRDDTGEGCHVDLAQRETGMVLIGEAFVAAARGEEPVHRGCRDARFAPQGAYRVRGEEQWLVVSVRTDDEWQALCGLVGRADLAGLTVEERRARHDELDGVLAAWLAPQRPQVAMEALQGVGVPAGRVLDSGSVMDDLHLLWRDYWLYVENAKMPRHKQQGVNWHLADAEPEPKVHAPFFGEHNAEILGELGLGADEQAALAAKAVIADAPINPGVG